MIYEFTIQTEYYGRICGAFQARPVSSFINAAQKELQRDPANRNVVHMRKLFLLWVSICYAFSLKLKSKLRSKLAYSLEHQE